MQQAQDMHFTQYYEHHALVNPALAGSEQDVRMVAASKSQWRKAAGTSYKSYGLSVDGKLLKGSWEKPKRGMRRKYDTDVGRLGGGFSVYRDKAGEAALGQIQLNGNLAAFVPVTKRSFISAGVQAGWAWRRMDGTDLIYPNQYRPGGYDASTFSGETMPVDRYRFFDLSAGAMWAYGFSQRGFIYTKLTKLRLGAAAYHLTTPKLRTVGNAGEDLKMKLVAHGDLLFNFKESNFAFTPNFIFQMQGKQIELLTGVMVKYYLVHSQARYTKNVKNTSINGGLAFRTKDALALTVLYESEERYAIALSYDINISKLRQANNLRGGPELMLRYTPRAFTPGPARD